MRTGFLLTLLCGFIVAGQIHAQEVIVARETKPEAPKQAAPPPEQTPPESPTPERSRSKPHKKKSTSEEPTLEQMRSAGALAAERQDNPSSSQASKSARSESEAAPSPSVAAGEPPRPVRKRKPPAEEPNISRRPASRQTKPEAIGAVRPTFMEAGRSAPSATPASKGQSPAP